MAWIFIYVADLERRLQRGRLILKQNESNKSCGPSALYALYIPPISPPLHALSLLRPTRHCMHCARPQFMNCAYGLTAPHCTYCAHMHCAYPSYVCRLIYALSLLRPTPLCTIHIRCLPPTIPAYLPICLFVCLPVYLSACLPICNVQVYL
jgi:hypothetical protein